MIVDDGPELDDDEQRERWRIHSDREATWALRKMAVALAEIERVNQNAADEMQAIRAWREAAAAGPLRDAMFFEQALIAYRHELEERDPELPKTYKVPGGVIARRKPPDILRVTDEPAFIAWALANSHRELLKIEPRVSGLKDYVLAPPDAEPDVYALIDENGTVVPGAEQVIRPDGYAAKPG